MLTNGEIENTRKLEQASKRFKESVDKLIKLEAMKAENEMRRQRGESLAYGEEHFMDLLNE